MRFYYAGGERLLSLLLDVGVKHVAVSLRYWRYVDIALLQQFDSVLIEAGGSAKNKTKQLQLCEQVYSELADNPRIIFGEFDAGTLQERLARIKRWKQELGITVAPVLSPQKFTPELFVDSKIVLIGGLHKLRPAHFISKLTPVFRELQLRNVHIHGLGIGKASYLNLPFNSISFTTWLSGTKYGVTFFWDGHILRHIRPDAGHARRRFKSFCEKHDIDFQAFMAGDFYATTRFSLLQWRLFEERMREE